MKRVHKSLDSFEIIPEDMQSYMSHYGKHFSKKMYEWAVSMMYKEDNEKIAPISKESFNNKLKQHSIVLENNILYDGMYVYCMAMADFYGSSLEDESHVMRYVKDYIDDPDAEDGFVFNRFYADCCLKGEPIDWEEML